LARVLAHGVEDSAYKIMEISITLETKTLHDIERFLETRPKRTREELNKAVESTVNLVKRNARLKVPVDTGHLKSRIKSRTFESKLAGEVFSVVRYAIPVHENLRARHKIGGAKYLKRAIDENKSKINKYFERAMSNTLKR